MPAVAVRAAIDFQPGGSVAGAIGSCRFGVGAGWIAVLRIARFYSTGFIPFFGDLSMPCLLAGEQIIYAGIAPACFEICYFFSAR